MFRTAKWVVGLVCMGITCAGLPRTGHAQVVQLPTVSVFDVGTTVVIPDRGAAYLGGVNRGAYGSSSSGVPGLSKIPGVNRLFSNRGIGSSVSSSSAYATATIHDLDEMDRQILAEARASRGARTEVDPAASRLSRKAAFLSENVSQRPAEWASHTDDPRRETVASVRKQAGAERQALERETQGLYDKGRAAENAGKPGVAKIYYQMARRDASDQLRREIDLRLNPLVSQRGQ